MRPESLTVAIRSRDPYEAMDLGLMLVQHYHATIYRAWAVVLIPAIIVALLVIIFLPYYASVSWLFVWWLKPLYDRVILLVLSQAVFGQAVTLHGVVKALPTFFKSGLLGDLTWRRFNFKRSFLLPVWQLEGQPKSSRKQRIRVLCERNGTYARWLTIVCVHLENLLMLTVISIVFLVIPEEIMPANIEFLSILMGETTALALLQGLGYLTGLLLIEPIYVAAGFALYINRRTELEAWDIELAFRTIAARLEKNEGSAS